MATEAPFLLGAIRRRTEEGIIEAVHSDGTYDVRIPGRAHPYTGVGSALLERLTYGAGVVLGFLQNSPLLPVIVGKKLVGRHATSGEAPIPPQPTIYPAIWLGPEGWPSLPGGPQAVEPQPPFAAASEVAAYGARSPNGRSGWHGFVLDDRDGGRQFVLLTDYEEDETTEQFTGDGSTQFFALAHLPTDVESVTVNGEEVDFDWEGNEVYLWEAPDEGAEIVVGYTWDSATGQRIARVGGPEIAWALSQGYDALTAEEHLLYGYLYLDRRDGHLAAVGPDGLRDVDMAGAVTLSAWPTESLRLAKDLGVSVGPGVALQHNWPEHLTTDPQRVIRGWTRAQGASNWEAAWTKPVFELAPGSDRVIGSGPVQRLAEGILRPAVRVCCLDSGHWVIGACSQQGEEDTAQGGLLGQGALTISRMSGATGAIGQQYVLQPSSDPILALGPGARETAASAQESTLAYQKSRVLEWWDWYWDPTRSPFDPPPYSPPLSNPTTLATYVGEPFYGWVYNEGTEEWEWVLIPSNHTYEVQEFWTVNGFANVLEGKTPGIPLPAPSHDPGEEPNPYQDCNGHVTLRHNQGRLYTVAFVPRFIEVGYSFDYVRGTEYIVNEHLKPSQGAWWVQYGAPIKGVYEVRWETRLICLDAATLAEVWAKDLTYRYLGHVEGQVEPLPVWRNVWDWSAKGRVIFLVRDWHYDATEGEELAEGADWEPVLEIYDLATQILQHRIRFEHSKFSFGAHVPDTLVAGVDADGREWAQCSLLQAGGSYRVLRVRMGEALDSAPVVTRHNAANAEQWPVGELAAHAAVSNGGLYWLRNEVELRKIQGGA